MPSEADALVESGSEDDLRRALELEPRRADAGVALARILADRGERDEALSLLAGFPGSFAAEGLAARLRLEDDDELRDAFAALDDGEQQRGLDVLIGGIAGARRASGARTCAAPSSACWTSSASSIRWRASRAASSPRRFIELRRSSGRRIRHAGHPPSGLTGRRYSVERLSCSRVSAPDHLHALESEAVHVFREVAAELERPVLLFSGGKDSIVLLRLAEKAFRPGRFPFPVLHVDTGHNFPEVLEFRDRRVEEIGERLIVAKVEDSIAAGRAREEWDPVQARHVAQPAPDRDAARRDRAGRFDAAFGGARRDEERARAKERIFSFRDDFGQWDPRAQRPELWNLYNGRIRRGEHVRVFPLSNWTELDVWHYIEQEELELPSIYFAHDREVFEHDGMLYAASEYVEPSSAIVHRVRALPHRRRHDDHRRGALERDAGRGRDHRDRRHARDRARRDARRRPHLGGGDGRPQAPGLLLDDRSPTGSSCCASRPPGRSTTASRR